MRRNPSPSARMHLRAALQALFVTFLWSTSWVFIKMGLQDMPALTFAGLRYCLAFLCLFPLGLYAKHPRALSKLSPRAWGVLLVLGLLYYTVTQGAQFLGLVYLPAMTTSLLLSFTTALVAVIGVFLIGESPTGLQWGGVGIYLSGVLIYFYPWSVPAGQSVGLIIVIVGVIANAISSVLGRYVNRAGEISPLIVTIVSMGVGGGVLLLTGLLTQGMPRLSIANWAIIAWLAIVNTAFAFTLWNHTLRTLSAVESSIINNTMLIQIPILAFIFLGEDLTWQRIVGMVVAGIGTLIVQLHQPQKERGE
jgi:drug/metabolite transporter (DMT)-like permease